MTEKESIWLMEKLSPSDFSCKTEGPKPCAARSVCTLLSSHWFSHRLDWGKISQPKGAAQTMSSFWEKNSCPAPWRGTLSSAGAFVEEVSIGEYLLTWKWHLGSWWHLRSTSFPFFKLCSPFLHLPKADDNNKGQCFLLPSGQLLSPNGLMHQGREQCQD